MDFGRIVSLLATVAEAVNEWFTRVLDATGATPFFIACFVVVLAVRFLLKPITGSSDVAGQFYADSKFAEADKARKEAQQAAKEKNKASKSASKSSGKKG